MSKTQIFQKANDPNENCSALTNTFLITEKHASLKKETVRGNYALSSQRVSEKPSKQEVD